eukprot:26281_1
MQNYIQLWWLLVVILFCQFLWEETNARIFYVSSDGHDQPECGAGHNYTACGSLYYVSVIMQNLSSLEAKQTIFIHVNGQNETTIIENIEKTSIFDLYHPCVPIPLTNVKNLTISFLDGYIFPDICSQLYNVSFMNEYIFDISADYLFINGLIIANHVFSENMQLGFIRNDKYAGITICSHCIFVNIHSVLNYPLIHILSSLQLRCNNFINITSENDLIFVHNIESNFLLHDNEFKNISTQTSIITYNYPFPVDSFQILTSNFIQIRLGSILKTQTVAGSDFVPNILIQNVNISTTQLYDDNENGLFNFDRGNIKMQNIVFFYDYDIFANCYRKQTGVILNMSYMSVSCIANTPFIINNYAELTLESVYYGHSLTNELFEQYKQYMAPINDFLYMSYEILNDAFIQWEIYSPVIWNRFIMHIVDFYVDGYVSGAGTFIVNEHILNIDKFQIISNNNFNPNTLHPRYIIQQNCHQSGTLQVDNSWFIGSEMQIHTTFGSVHITNSMFENATEALQIWYSDDILIQNNSFNRIGRYYGGFRAAFVQIHNWPTSVSVFSKNIIVANNKFNCWDPDGLIVFYQSENIIMRQNILNIDVTNLLYTIPESLKIYEAPGYAVVSVIESANSSIILNEFQNNPIDPFGTPWIKYSGNIDFHLDSIHGKKEKYGPLSCLSANNFTNYAIATADTNITSCFRRGLIQCLFDDMYCVDGKYGTMDVDLLNAISVFNISLNEIDIFKVETNNSFIALDNLYIVTNNENEYDLQINTGHILLFDSLLTNVDIIYNKSLCYMRYNNRLETNPDFIAKLMIICGNSNSKQ